MTFQIIAHVKRVQQIELRDTPYLEWPQEARALAKVVMSNSRSRAAALSESDRKDWLAEQVERMQAENRSIAEWLGEA